MVKQFIIRLLSATGERAVKFVNTNNLFSANAIAESLYADKWKIVSVSEVPF